MPRKSDTIELGKQDARQLMKRVLECNGWRYRNCGSLESLRVHRKIRQTQQGNNSLDDLVTLLAYCHMEQHDQLTFSAFADGR